jgi:hypothetical protein
MYIDVYDTPLSRKWLKALEDLLKHGYHLEKNYCWLGWAENQRNVVYICDAINRSVDAINTSNLGYTIHCDPFTSANTITVDLNINHDRMNMLHRWFEDLQGWSGSISDFYKRADADLKWHIRQLNLLCHELESLILSIRKKIQAPEWQRPSQLMCWLNAPRFDLDENDLEFFGIDTINRQMGGVYLGVNKAVGKHHWEVFNDEGRDSRISELTTTSLRSQTQAAGDFDIEWGKDPGAYHWQQKRLQEFRQWLSINGFDPNDKALTIGHPKVGQVNLSKSFSTTDAASVWQILQTHLDVYEISTCQAKAVYEYHWKDPDYAQQQIKLLH